MHYFCSKDCLDTCCFEIIDQGPGKMPLFRAIGRAWDERPFVCRKLAKFYRREVLTPGSSFWRDKERRLAVDTHTALDYLADFLAPRRDLRILYLRGSGSLGYNMHYWDHLMAGLPNCHFVKGSPCMNAGETAHEIDFGVCENLPVGNLDAAGSILLFGRNARAVSPHFHALLRRWRGQGKRIVHIDPVRTRSAESGTAHVQIRPGCDGLLAAALLVRLGLEKDLDHEALYQEAGVSAADFDLLVDCLGAGPCGIVTGTGLQRYVNGCNTVRWINRLAARSGNVERLYYGRSSKACFVSRPVRRPHEVPLVDLPRLLDAGRFDLLWIVAANPLLSYPESEAWRKALSRTPSVVVDAAMSATAELATWFLRVGGMFNQPDLQGSFFFRDAETERAEAYCRRSPNDLEVISALGERLGIDVDIRAVAEVQRRPAPIRPAFQESALDLARPTKAPAGRYRLLSSSSERHTNSQWLPEDLEHENFVAVAPALAARHDLAEGDLVRISSEVGTFISPCHVSERLPDDLIMVYKSRPLTAGWCNMAIPSLPTDAGDGLAYYDAFVWIERQDRAA